MIRISSDYINRITFGTDDAARAAFQCMLHQVRAEGQPLGSIDFNKLVPIPPELNMEADRRTDAGLKLYRKFLKTSALVSIATLHATSEEREAAVREHLKRWEKVDPELWTLGKKAYQNIQKYDVPTQYEWVRLHWGCLVNAEQCVPLDANSHTMEFHTFLCPVPKIMAALSQRFPTQTVAYSWSGGEPVQHLGRMVFQDGKAVSIDVPENELALACAMSSGVWRFGAKVEHPKETGQPQRKKAGRKEAER